MRCDWCNEEIKLEDVGTIDRECVVCQMCLSLEVLGVRRGGKSKNSPWVKILGEQVATKKESECKNVRNDS
jgi:hypothetical protein